MADFPGDYNAGNVAFATEPLIQSGFDVIPRSLVNPYEGVLLSTGVFRTAFFRAPMSMTVGNLLSATWDTAAAATPTLCRMGLYSYDPVAQIATLIAACANDTTLWNAAFTSFQRAVTAPANVVRGQYYCIGMLCVTAVAAPNVVLIKSGLTNNQLLSNVPWSGTLGAQADLPASFTRAALSASNTSVYMRLLP